MLINGDCREVLKTLDANSVDVVVTSYPYKVKDGYSHDLMFKLGQQLGRVLKPGGIVFLNGGQLKEDFNQPYTARSYFARGAAGNLVPWQTICWVKSVAIDGAQRGHYQPINSKHIINYGWEPIFVFLKQPLRELDRLSIGVPYADKSNLSRGTRGKHGDLHCAGDVWFIPYKTTGATSKKPTHDMRHAYSYPETLVERCLKLAGVRRGHVVLDPFAGSGTTLRVAEKLGAKAIGVSL